MHPLHIHTDRWAWTGVLVMSSALLLGWPLSAAAHTADSRTGSSTSTRAIADGAIGIWSNGTTMWEADRSGDGLDAGAPAGVTRAKKRGGGRDREHRPDHAAAPAPIHRGYAFAESASGLPLTVLRAGDVRAAAPTGFAASNGNEQVTLTWDAPAEDADIARHEYRFRTTGVYPAAWTEINDSAPGGLHEDWVVVTDLTNDVAYTFELRTVNAGGDASTAVEAGPVTPKDGVCGRTEQVRDAIVDTIANVSDCADVTTTQLAGVTVLDLSVAGIKSLHPGDFSELTALTELSLHNSELSSLPDGVFSGLTALETLSLHNNELSSLPDGVFSGLTALETLSLHNSELSSLPDGVFSGLTALTRLNLRDNDFSSLPDGVFSGLTALTSLTLGGNDLSSLPDGVFSGLTALAALHLNDNDFSSLPDGVFSGLTALASLNLSSNDFSSLPDGVFSRLTALTRLDLRNNDLSSLPDGVFSGLTALLTLYLHNNELSSLPDGVFSGLTALTTLNLGGNDLSSLPDGVFSGLTALQYLYLDRNAVDPLALAVTLEKNPDAVEIRAVVPAAAPFAVPLSVSVANGGLAGDVSTLTVPIGARESAWVGVTRTDGTTGAVTADIDLMTTEQNLPSSHQGYAFVKSATDLPLRVLDAAPAAPAAPSVSAASSSSLTVIWLAPDNAGPAITDYDVQYRAGTSGSWTDAGYNGTATTATLTGLSENTSYQVQVRATSDEGTGAWSDAGTGATDPNTGICGRTPRVRDRMLVLLKYRHSYKGDCSGVEETHLAKLESLDLGRNPSIDSPFTMSLQGGDFEGLVNLERLYMRETGLQSLPAAVFDGLVKLKELELNKNELQSLPAGVFSDLRSLESLKLQNNPPLASLPFDEFEALPQLTKLLVDRQGRRKLQVADGEGDASLEVAAGRSATYRVRLMATTNARAAKPVKVTVSSDVSAVTASPVSVSFTSENWFRRQTVTVSAAASASGTTAKLTHAADGAYYAYDRWPLPGVTVTVVQSGQSGDAAGLTAEFEGLPPEGYGGETAFSFRIAFSEDVATSADDMCDHAFQASGGAVRGAKRLQKGSNRMWEMTVKPNSNGPVTITLPATTDCGADGAICTGDGRPLSHALSATLRGPAGTMEQDRAVRLCSALAGGDDITPATAAAALWEDGDMSDDRLAALDSLGNGNGSYDLGDLLAWTARCRRGEGPGSASGTDPPADHLVSSISVHSPGDDERDGLPVAFALRGNYPNPFQRATQIVFDLPWRADVTVDVLDVLGRRMLSIPSQPISGGWERRIDLSGVTLPSGPYLYRVQASAQAGEGVSVLVGRFVHIK